LATWVKYYHFLINIFLQKAARRPVAMVPSG
jgi:hypothetical protein